MDQINPKWFEEHENRNQQLRAKGVILASGPFVDGSGGCIVYNCSQEEFMSIIQADPLVIHDVVDYDYKDWNAALSAKIQS